MSRPLRIQRRREKGWRKPDNTVCVTRPGRWKNPCKVGMYRGYDHANAKRDFERYVERDLAVRSFENAFGRPPTLDEIRLELRGKNLACYCKLCPEHAEGKPFDVDCPACTPCHADVLGRIANAAEEIPDGGACHSSAR